MEREKRLAGGAERGEDSAENGTGNGAGEETLEEILRRVFGPGGGSPRRQGRAPGALQLRGNVRRVAAIPIGAEGIAEVFANGYAVYDNGDRKTVVWLPDCAEYTWFFVRPVSLSRVPEGSVRFRESARMEAYPWVLAVLLAGEDRIQGNRGQGRKERRDEDKGEKPGPVSGAAWIPRAGNGDPEEEMIRREWWEEIRMTAAELGERQRIVLERRYGQDMPLREIAAREGVSIPALIHRLDRAVAHLRAKAEELRRA